MNALAKTGSLFIYLSNFCEKLLPALFQGVDTGGGAVQKRHLARPWVGHKAETVCRNGVLETMVRRPEPIAPPLLWPSLRTADLLETPTIHATCAMRKADHENQISRLRTHSAREAARLCAGLEPSSLLVEFACFVRGRSRLRPEWTTEGAPPMGLRRMERGTKARFDE